MGDFSLPLHYLLCLKTWYQITHTSRRRERDRESEREREEGGGDRGIEGGREGIEEERGRE